LQTQNFCLTANIWLFIESEALYEIVLLGNKVTKNCHLCTVEKETNFSLISTELSFNFFTIMFLASSQKHLLVTQLFRGLVYFVYHFSVSIVFILFSALFITISLELFLHFLFILYFHSFEFLLLAFAYFADFYHPLFSVFSTNFFFHEMFFI
jgi:hypothetical protein